MIDTPDRPELRQGVLAVSVLADLDLLPGTHGVVLPGLRAVEVPWSEVSAALGGYPPLSVAGRLRLTQLFTLHRAVAGLGPQTPQRLRSAARALALPPGHCLHPGRGWVRERVLGGALDLGLGLLGLGPDPDRVVPLPASVAARAGISPTACWPAVRAHLDRMGALAAARVPGPIGRRVLGQVGGCEPLALLAAPALRAALAGLDGVGMATVAVPSRTRGWYDPGQLDRRYVGAVWSLTAEQDRGLPVPVLVTRAEVAVPQRSGCPSR